MAYEIKDFDTALGFMADKRLDVSQMINCRAGFADLQNIFENLHHGDCEIVKAVVRP
jgi:threonine dehydrogenase-like Zn-dependent dehydrogenase